MDSDSCKYTAELPLLNFLQMCVNNSKHTKSYINSCVPKEGRKHFCELAVSTMHYIYSLPLNNVV